MNLIIKISREEKNMNKRKKVILATISIGTLLTATLVPVFLFTKDNENNKEIDQKIVDGYVEKLKKLTPKEVTIKETSGSVTKNKNFILRAIKNLDKFPSIPTGVNLEVKDDSKNLTLQGVAITLAIKKDLVTKEVTGFKVKRSMLDQEIIDGFVEKLKALVTKEVTISQTSGSVTDNKDFIKTKLETLANFPVVPSGVSWEVKEEATALTTVGVNIILTVSKGLISQDVRGFTVKRSVSDQEVVDDFILKLNNLVTKEVTISQTSGSVTYNKDFIKTKLETLANFPTIPSGVSWEVKEEATALTTVGVNIILTVSKGLISQDVRGFSAKRTKTQFELDTDSINSVKKILDGEGQKVVTIINIQAKVGAIGVSTKIVAKLQETIGASNLDRVTIEVKADSTNADIIDTGDGIGFIITLSKGSVSKEISNWRVLRTKPMSEQNTDSVNKVKKILDDQVPKLVTIESAQAKVGDVGVPEKIVAKLQETIGASNLDGVTIEVKADSTNADIIDTGTGIGFIITLSKGSVSKEISNWKVLRTKPMSEQNTDSVNKVKKILDDQVPKLVTIESAKAKVGDVGVPEKIVAKLQEVIESSNLDGVTISVKADTTNAIIPNAEPGIGFIITLSKGSVSKEISNWKVLRTKTSDELIADNYKNELTNNLKNPFSKDILIKIGSTSGTLEENKVAIIKAIKATYLFISPPTGFDIRLRPGQNEIIPITRIVVDIEIFKVFTGETLALISKNDFYAFVVRRSKTPSKKIDSHFSDQSNKVVNIPYEKESLTYKNLDENAVLRAVKKALVFANPSFWTTTLLNKITLKPNQNITNFDVARNVIIKYGENDNEKEVTINVKKFSKGETIEEYFKSYIIDFDIPSWIKITTVDSILTAIRSILVNKDPKLWTITKNSITQSSNNKLSTLTQGANEYSIFKATYTINGSLKEIDLSIRHLSTGSEIEKYFAVIERNYEARKINIPSSIATLDTAKKIFDAIKNYLKAKDDWTWKDHLLDELAISNTNNTTSLVKGDPPKPFIVEYTNDANEVVTLMLKVKHLSE